MLSSLFRKYAVGTQTRQFSTALICSRNRVERHATYCWSDSKCANSVNINHNVSVLRSFNSSTNKNIYLQPLMDAPLYKRPLFLNVYIIPISILIMQFHVDPDFTLEEYVKGFLHATLLISNALAAKNYEALEGFVEQETLETVKHNVDSLDSSQRELIAINKDFTPIVLPISIKVQRIGEADNNEYAVEITHIMYYYPASSSNESDVKSQKFNAWFKLPVIANYTFRRTYRNNAGGSWVAKVVNHFTFNFKKATNS